MKKFKSLVCIAALGLGLFGSATAITILSVAGSNNSQVTGGTLMNQTLSNIYADFASILTVLGSATGAPSGSGAVCLTTSCTMITPALGTPSALVLTNATGTPSSIVLTNATGTPASAGVMLDTGSIALTLSQLQTLNSVPLQIIAAPGATSMIQMGACTLNLTFGSAAFTGGGTVSIGYGTSSSPATNGTIASTVFTTFSSSHGVVVAPVAVAVTATTSLANKGIFMTATAADFAAGTGGSGQVDCNYRIVTGVS